MYNDGILYITIFEAVVYRILRCVERYCMLSVRDILDHIPYPDAGYSDSFSVSVDVKWKSALQLATVGVFYTIPNCNTQ